MKSRILHSSYVLNFLDVNFNTNQISELLKTETDELLQLNNFVGLENWEVQFRATYGKDSMVKIYTKMSSYKNERQKLIIIHIPIPTTDTIEWGVDSNQYIYSANNPNADKNLYFLKIDYSQFANRQDYIIDCIRRGIRKAFEEGFTVNGIKVKIKG